MPPLQTPTGDHQGGVSRTQSKRKRSQQPSRASEGFSQPRQSTISELFSSPPSLVQSSESGDKPKKRSKSVQLTKAAAATAPHGNPQPAPNMVPSTPSMNHHHNVIDLTSSPDQSPSMKAAHGSKNTGGRGSSNFLPYSGARRLVIKNLRQTPRTSPKELLDRTWTRLDAALTAIFNGDKIPHSLEELYRGVENVCRHQGAPELFQSLKARCTNYVQTSIKPQLAQLVGKGAADTEALEGIHGAWVRWNSQVLTTRSIFYFMDRSYLLSSNIHPTIDEMATSLFETHVFSDSAIKPKVLQAMCDLIDNERRGCCDQCNSSLLRDSVRMAHDLGVYTSDFEYQFLKASELYFIAWGEKQSTGSDLTSYVQQCTVLIDGEMVRCDSFHLDSSTRRELLVMLQELLIRQKAEILVNTESVYKLLDTYAVDVLQALYALLQRVDLHGRLKVPWEAWLRSVGSAIVRDEQRRGEMVVRLLELRTRADLIWKSSFRKHSGLGHALRDSFEHFINDRQSGSASNSTPGEMIAKHIDMLLRGGAKVIPSALGASSNGPEEDDFDTLAGDEDAELGKQLDRALDLFRFIEGKDIFEAFYKKDLARRLLMARSASADAERNMLTKLKNECGSAFTHNLEQMFKDVDLARDEMASYKQMREERGRSNKLDLNVNVLCSAAWPSYPDSSVNIPGDILSAIDEYDRYYKAKHKSRHLNWKHSLAHCVVKARFSRGNKELVVSSFQAIVMLLFNETPDGSYLTYEQIQSGTGLSDDELTRTLQSLACAKYRVLTKKPKGRDVNRGDKFAVNLGFTDVKYRIKINQIQLKETKEENKATHEDVTRDRQYEAQATIVRIMKNRKTITAPELMAETINMTKKRGVLEAAEIKKQIDKLIEKDYLERVVEDGRILYKYLA